MAFVDTQARLRDAVDALDNGTACIVLQGNFEFRLATVRVHLETVDVALVLQHSGNGRLQLRGGHRHGSLVYALRITDARQHIGDRIAHAHKCSPTSLPWSCPELHRA